MATFEGFEFIGNFAPFFTFLFSFALVYAVMEAAKPFGAEKKNIHGLIAFFLAALLMFSKSAVNIMNFMAPWFVIIIFAFFFVIFIVMMFGADTKTLKDFITNTGPDSQGKNVIQWIVAIVIILLVIGLSNQLGQSIGPYLTENNETQAPPQGTDPDGITAGNVGSTNTGNFQQNLGATIFHPKVLGMIAIFIIASFGVRYISMES